jgi:hypothetical protein
MPFKECSHHRLVASYSPAIIRYAESAPWRALRASRGILLSIRLASRRQEGPSRATSSSSRRHRIRARAATRAESRLRAGGPTDLRPQGVRRSRQRRRHGGVRSATPHAQGRENEDVGPRRTSGGLRWSVEDLSLRPVRVRWRDISCHDEALLDLASDEAASHDAHVFCLFLPQRKAGGDPIALRDLV